MDEDRETTFDPSTAEIDRGRQQGLGVGERELKGQRDPGGVDPEAESQDDGAHADDTSADAAPGDQGAGI